LKPATTKPIIRHKANNSAKVAEYTMLKGRLQWQLLVWIAGIVAVNLIANLWLFYLARSVTSFSAGRLLLFSAIASTLLMIAGGVALWLASRALTRLSRGMKELQRGAYPLLVAPTGNPLADHIRQFNQLSSELRTRDEKTKTWAKNREGELAKASRLLRLNSSRVEALRAMPEGLLLLDDHNCICGVDQTAAELIGARPESLSNTPLDQLTMRLRERVSDPASFDERFAMLRSGEATELRLELQSPREALLRIARMRIVRPNGDSADRNLGDQPQPNTDVERMKSEFLSTVSHELRTPLTSIKGSLSLVQSGSTGHIPADARELLDIALSNADRLIATINNVLDVAQLEYGGVQFEVSPVSLANIVDEAMQAVRPEAVTRNARIDLSLPQPPPVMTVDARRIAQVLRHLLSNAIKFSNKNSQVVLSAKIEGEAVVLSVQDFGVGISREFMGKLFQKFEHEQDALTRDTQGCGLGLTICKLVVEAHGGRIWAESVEGSGSTFFVSLPVAPSQRTILVVDDDDDLQRSMAAFCDRRGYRVLACHNPREVVTLARSYRPHLVALDVLAPAGTSAEVCRRLADDPATQAIPVVCFVADRKSPAYTSGPNLHLLAKPLDESEFGSLLDRMFARPGGNGA
jgi:signal transduction histidine kinase